MVTQPAGMMFFRPAVEVRSAPLSGLGDYAAIIGGAIAAVGGAASSIANAFAAPEQTKQAELMSQAQVQQAQLALLGQQEQSKQTTTMVLGGIALVGLLGLGAIVLKK